MAHLEGDPCPDCGYPLTYNTQREDANTSWKCTRCGRIVVDYRIIFNAQTGIFSENT